MDYKRSALVFIQLLFLTMTLAACSKNHNTVVAEIKIIKGNAALNLSNGAGGVVLYGKSDKGDGFGKIIDPAGSGSFTLELPNGNWDFYAFAWQGPGIFQGTVFCSYSSTNLTGVDAGVSVNLANTNCSNPAFSPYMNGTSPLTFPTPKIISCSRELSEFSPTALGNECDGLANSHQKGYFVSYKVSLLGYNGKADSPTVDSELTSGCITNSALTNTTQAGITLSVGTSGAINLPIAGGLPLPTKVYAYYGTTDCDTTTNPRGFKTYDFNYGINSAPTADVKNYAFVTSDAGINLYLNAKDYEACSDNRAYETPFAAGTGGAGTPYILCNDDQFNNIGTSYLTSHFRLGADIDFNWGSMTPIGGTGAPATFSGNFYGDYHTIKNLMVSPAYVSVGLIRQATNGVLVNNLTISDVHFDAGSTTTAAILIGNGTPATSTPIVIDNVDFRSTGIFAGTQVGTAIGTAQKIKLIQVHVSGGHVEGRTSKVGGLVGEINLANAGYFAISKSDFKGEVSGYQAAQVGGIAGYVIASSDMAEVRVEGTVKGYSDVGGIVGMGLGNISDSYSLASVDVSGASQYSGAIAGTFTGTMTNTFATLGTITSVTATYNGGLKGVGAGTVNTSFYANNGSAGAGTSLSIDNLHTNSQLTGFSIGTTTGAIWHKAATDDTYDYPRLTWELDEEYYLPYLARECSGYFGSTVGSGTYADPEWVCTKDQFLAMNASPGNYILKRNIDFNQHAFTSTSAIAVVDFNLDGDNYAVANVLIAPGALSFNGADCHFGLFGKINAGQTVENLVLSNVNYTVSYSSIFAAGNCWISAGNPIPMKVGTLAGLNQGTINKVTTKKSKIAYSATTSAPTTTSQQDAFGGLVGINSGSTAMITGSRVDTELALSMNITTTSDDEINVGGVVGKNMNSASINKTHSRSRLVKFTGDLYYNTFLGGIAGQNDSSAAIYEVASEGELVVNPSAGPATYLNVGGIVGYNNSALSNSFARVRFDLNANNNTTNYIGGVVAYNSTSGSINKTFYTTGYTDNTITPSPRKGITAGNTGTVALSYCVEASFTPANGFNSGSGVTGSAVSYSDDVSTNCLLDTTPAYSYSAGAFAVTDGTLSYTYTTWNMTNDWYNRYSTGAVWLLDSMSSMPIQLIYASDH